MSDTPRAQAWRRSRRQAATLRIAVVAALMLCACGSDRRLAPPATATPPPTAAAPAEAPASFFALEATTIDGEPIDLSRYAGKHVLVVNVASECGYTPQYADLQTLYERYGDRVVVLGFPANDFMGQEPGSDAEIAAFCEKNYGVTFPMFAKTSVVGDAMHPVYQWLTRPDRNGWNEQAPTWNFSKYLISPDGALLRVYGSSVSPLDPELLTLVDPDHAGPRQAPAAPDTETTL